MKGTRTMDLTFLSPENSECFSYAFILFNISKLDSQVESTQIFSSVAPRGCIHPARALFSLWPFSFTRYKAVFLLQAGLSRSALVPSCSEQKVVVAGTPCSCVPPPLVFLLRCVCPLAACAAGGLPELHPLSSIPSQEARQVKILG